MNEQATGQSPDEMPALSTESEDFDYELEPADPQRATAATPEIPEDINETWLRHYREQNEWDFRISISDIMALTAGVAVVLTVTRWFPASVMAAAVGFVALISLIFISTTSHRSSRMMMAWCGLMLLYLVTSLVAAIQG